MSRYRWHVRVAIVLFLIGITAPAFTSTTFIFFSNSQSILSLIGSLFGSGEVFLGLIVLLFSVIFPTWKIFMLRSLIRGKGNTQKILRRLHFISKWSMTDVFIVAFGIVIAKASGMAGLQPKAGIFAFAASALLVSYISHRAEQHFERQEGKEIPDTERETLPAER